MSTGTIRLILNLSIVVVTIIALIYFLKKDKITRSGKAEWVKKQKLHNKYVKYNNSVLLRKRFRRIVMRYSTLSCYSVDTVKEESVKLFEKAIKVSIAMPLISVVALRDVTLSILVAFVGYIYYNITVDKEIDKIYVAVMRELSICIQSIIEGYMNYESIPKAILYCDKGKLLDKAMTQIYEILTDVDGEERLYEFSRMSPVRQLKTLAEVCYIKNECGDERNGDGSSAFVGELTTVWQEIDGEIRRLEKTRIAFKSLATMTLVGLATAPIADAFLLSQIPGTSLLIKGMYGVVEKMLLIGATILSYYIISVINRPSVVNQTDKIGWIDVLSKNKRVKTKLQDIIPKKYKTRMKLNLLVKDSISSKTMEYIYLTKVIFSVTAFVSVLVIMICFVFTTKSFLWNNYKSLGFIPSAAVEEKTFEQIKIVDREYMTQKEKLPDEEAYILVKARVRGMAELECRNQVKRLSTKWDKYYGMGFKWYFMIIAYIAAIVGWYTPEISLTLRKKLVSYEVMEDVLQLQTMMIVLSNTKMDVFRALYWLEKQSTIHKAPLQIAYHEYTSDPEGALERLAASVSSTEFKRIAAKLSSAIYNLSLKDAFCDMLLSKQQSMSIQDMLQMETLESKTQWAKLISKMPLSITIMGNLVGPIIILAFTELMKTFGTLM